MPLKNATKPFFISSDVLEESEFIRVAKKKMGIKLYDMAIRVFTEYISQKDETKSGGYFQFAHIVGHAGQAPKKDVDYLWDRMIEVYGDDEAGEDTIHRVLGTICMICVTKDPRTWVYVEDMEKRDKLLKREIPNANEYFIGSYTVKQQKKKVDVNVQDSIKQLQKKFGTRR